MIQGPEDAKVIKAKVNAYIAARNEREGSGAPTPQAETPQAEASTEQAPDASAAPPPPTAGTENEGNEGNQDVMQ